LRDIGLNHIGPWPQRRGIYDGRLAIESHLCIGAARDFYVADASILVQSESGHDHPGFKNPCINQRLPFVVNVGKYFLLVSPPFEAGESGVA